MRNYFVEIRPLILDEMETDEEEMSRQWFAATSPRIEGVDDGVLGTWNTVTLRDGLYEIRLKINTAEETEEYVRVSPIRVENSPPPFVSEVWPRPSLSRRRRPEPTATPDLTPRVVANVNSNVRSGDNTLYPVIGNLLEGDSAKIRGISSFNTGWYYIELANGRSGFIFPGIVRTEGDLGNLPRINPPPLPPTPIPLPTAIPVVVQPQTGANLRFDGVVIDPHPATCNEAYRIDVTVRNDGSGGSTSGGLIEVRDSREDSQGPATTQIAFGPIGAGQAVAVFGHLTQSQWYDTNHNINLYLDIHNQIGETNENDNHHATAQYVLKRGKC